MEEFLKNSVLKTRIISLQNSTLILLYHKFNW